VLQANDTLVSIKNAGLKLPPKFIANIIADNLGRARHIAVAKQGHIFIKLMRTEKGAGIVQLSKDNTGNYSVVKTFGNYGGTGIAVKGNALFASSDNAIYKYNLDDNGNVTNATEPETIVSGLINRRQHESKSITLDDAGNVYVNIGAYSNSCQEKDRTKGSLGINPCPILDSAGGIWQFSANKNNQTYADGVRYATGLRNVVGLDWNSKEKKLFVMQHGRDQLHDLFPDLYDENTSADLPAETMYAITKGANAGWPYTYFDPKKNAIMQAPEYGGDGNKKATGNYLAPAIAFPAHMAPNGLLFYTGSQFPEKYKNGAFIAFHGSWNRTSLPQEGYYVVFVPFSNGLPTGKWEVFANGFSGKEVVTSPRNAAHRPCGLAQDIDGSLLVTDDVKGTIYKIAYQQ